jgi:type I restriction enzyme S subunit
MSEPLSLQLDEFCWKTIPELVGRDGLFVDGDWVESKDQDPNGDVRLIQLADVGEGVYRDRSARFLTSAKAKELGCTYLRAGDILVARMPDPLGRACVFPGDSKPAVTVVDVCVIRSGKGEFEHRWLVHILNSPQARTAVAALEAGTTRKRISRKNLGIIKLPVPRLDNQRATAAEIEKQFSRLDAGISALKRVQANLKRYRAAVLKAACEGRLAPTEAELARQEGREYETGAQLLERSPSNESKKRAGRLWGAGHVPDLTEDERHRLPLGWAWTTVYDLGSSREEAVQVGPMSMRSADFEADGVSVLNVGCVQWDRFEERKLDHLPLHKAVAFARYRIMPGDILFTRSGTVGRCAVAQPHQNGWLMTFHLLRVRPNHSLCMPRYLRAVFEGAAHIRRQTREGSVGSTRAGFNTNLLGLLAVPLPPLAEQERIVAEVERRFSMMEQIEAAVEAGLKRAARLRQAVLQKTFGGCSSDSANG